MLSTRPVRSDCQNRERRRMTAQPTGGLCFEIAIRSCLLGYYCRYCSRSIRPKYAFPKLMLPHHDTYDTANRWNIPINSQLGARSTQ